MSRKAKTKAELLESIHDTRAALKEKFSGLTPQQMTYPGSMDDWSVKDILAHLVDWEQRFVGWYRAGLAGEVPETPAPGKSWRDLPIINQLGYEAHKDDNLEQVLQQFEQSYQETLALVENLSEEEIFEPGYYAWTAAAPLLDYIYANTTGHYEWARRNIRTSVLRKIKA